MHLKKIIVIGALLSISACSERNQAYYEANIDEAELKVKDCEAAMKAAFLAQDEEQLESVTKDPECKFAIKVFGEHKKNLANIKREIEAKELEKEKEQQEKIFKQQYTEQLVALKKLPYSEYVSLSKECRPQFMSKGTAKCSAYKELKQERETTEITALKEKYIDGKLEAHRDKSCAGIQYDQVVCQLSRVAAQQQKKEKIDYYIANRDQLKIQFNLCHKKYNSLVKLRKYNEARASVTTYQCSIVGNAAAKLKVHSFKNPIG